MLVVLVGGSFFLYVYALKDDLVKQRLRADVLIEQNRALIKHILDDRSLVDRNNEIVELRDFVYRKTIVGPGDFDYQNPVNHFISLDNGASKMLCGGMAQTYSWLLNQHGIPARTVQLATQKFVEGLRRNDTHVSVEVFDANLGTWIVSDPTFNVSFKCDGIGPLLNFSELYQCKSNGKMIEPIENGYTYIEGRRVNQYYLPYSDLLYGIKASEVSGALEALEVPSKGWLKDALSLYDETK